jgi:hypothetical protein
MIKGITIFNENWLSELRYQRYALDHPAYKTGRT